MIPDAAKNVKEAGFIFGQLHIKRSVGNEAGKLSASEMTARDGPDIRLFFFF